MAFAIGAKSSRTWTASSRVGTRTRAPGPFPEVRRIRSTIGIAKASVLPEPVSDFASTSDPDMASRITSAWTGKGAITPTFARAPTTASETPRSSNDLLICQAGYNSKAPSSAPTRCDTINS